MHEQLKKTKGKEGKRKKKEKTNRHWEKADKDDLIQKGIPNANEYEDE